MSRRAEFETRGFIGPIDVLTPDEVVEFRQRLDAIRHDLDRHRDTLYEVEQAYSERPDEVVCHFLGGWMIDDAIRALLRDERITGPCAELLGVDRLRFWHDQVFYKPPRHPGVVPWHQDYSYWTRTTPANHITLNLMLDDADEQNGCLQFVPGSHRWGLLPSLPFDSDLDAIREHLADDQVFAPVPMPLRAGQASIHHSHTLHGSDANRSDRPRRAMVFNYMGAETRVADGSEPLLKGTPCLATGALVEGDHFPIVWSAE